MKATKVTFLVSLMVTALLWNIGCAKDRFSEYPVVGIYADYSQAAKDSGVDILFPSIYWWDFDAHLKAPDSWKKHVDTAHRNGMKVIPSLALAIDGISDRIPEYPKNHLEFTEKKQDGSPMKPYGGINLSWGYPQVREYKLNTVVKEVIESGVDGVLLDYTRYFGTETGYSDIIVKEFREKYNKDPFKISKDDPEWVQFRADYITMFIRDLRQALDKLEPRREIWGCVGPDPEECLNSSMNDWGEWVEKGYLDGILTMVYENDTNNTLKRVMIANAATKGKVPHIPMIAAGYSGSLESAAQLRDASIKCLKTGTVGIAYYRGDSIANFNHWVTIKEVANWNKEYVDAQRANYMLNPSFEKDLTNWALGDGDGMDISSEKARTGEKCLMGRFPEGMQIRQIVDRGFFRDRTALQVSAWIDTEQMPEKGSLSIELTANYTDGNEDAYSVPIIVKKKEGWQNVKGSVAIRNADKLKFVIVGFKASAANGKIYIDDIAVNLTNDKVEPEQWLVKAAKPVDSKGRVNVTLGQLVRGSSFWENGREYDNAVDGDISCANFGKGASWHSQRPPFDQWIKIYLGQVYVIRKIRLLNSSANRGYRTKDYKIEVSRNDLNYKQVASGTLPNEGKTWTEVEIKATPTKYIKFTGITGYSSTHAVGLKEIEIY